MTDRANSPAMAVLPKAARKILDAIETAVGNRSSAAVTYLDFQFDYGLGRLTVTKFLPLLVDLGLLEIEIGPNRGNVYRPSNGWRTVTANDAQIALMAHTQKTRKSGRTIPAMRHSSPPRSR